MPNPPAGLRLHVGAPQRAAAEPLRLRGTLRTREAVRIRLRDADGGEGHGEAIPLPGYGRETAATVAGALAAVAAKANAAGGLAVTDTVPGGAKPAAALLLDSALSPFEAPLSAAPGARFALECALIDLLARRAGQSAAHWLAAGRTLQPVPLSVLLPDDGEAAIAAAAAAAARGIAVLKLKIVQPGRGDAAEDALLAAVRSAADAAVARGHPAPRLRLDANGALDAAAVPARFAALARYGIELVEEPCSGAAALALPGNLPLPWAADESLADPALAAAVLVLPPGRRPAALVLKPALLGLARCLSLAEAGAARGFGLIVTHSLDGDLGHAAARALAAALPVPPWPCGLAPHPGLRYPAPQGAWLPPPTAAGLDVPADATGRAPVPLFAIARPRPAEHPVPPSPPGPTLGDALRKAAAEAPREPGLVGDFGTLSWAELAQRVAAVAAGLRALAAAGDGADRDATGGVRRPHAVALRPDRDDLVVVLAHATAGIPLLPLHPSLPEAEAARLAGAAGAKILSRETCLTAARCKAMADAGADPGHDLFLVATSGSSGDAKIARLTHHAVLAAAAALNARLPFGAHDRWILTLPLSHVGGLSVVARCLLARRPIVLVPRFHEDAVWTAIARDAGNRLSAVPAIADRLLAAGRPGLLARLNLVMLGGQAAPPALRRALREAGVPAVTSYGLTESCAAAACESPDEAGQLLPGSGRALHGMETTIADDAGAALPAGEPGRILLAGRALLAGYAGRPEVKVRDAAGRLDTGDLGWIDRDGRLHVQGRRSEVIVTAGEKVVPGVVEAVLRQHPAVRDAVVFGVPDARWGAIVCAAVEGAPAEGAPALAADPALAGLLAAQLPPWARPRRLAVFEVLPRLANGKVDRRGTPAQAAARLHALAASHIR